MDLSALRKEYALKGLAREDLATDPFDQFKAWFEEACDKKILEPNAMVVSTVSGQGQPSCRTVLLKRFDERGFVFFTNYESHKASDIEHNNQVGLLFPWIALERQVLIQGIASKVSREESREYFLKRPLKSQLGAWASDQSRVVDSRTTLEKKYQELEKRFKEEPMDVPPNWGGYLVKPSTIEFWQGRESRLHDRFRYRYDGHSWVIERLEP